MSLHKFLYSIAIGVAVIVGYLSMEMLPQRYVFFRTTGFYVVIV